MNNRKLVISCCDQCPHFDNEYYGYSEECRLLDRKIEKDCSKIHGSDHTIPEDCPLEKE